MLTDYSYQKSSLIFCSFWVVHRLCFVFICNCIYLSSRPFSLEYMSLPSVFIQLVQMASFVKVIRFRSSLERVLEKLYNMVYDVSTYPLFLNLR